MFQIIHVSGVTVVKAESRYSALVLAKELGVRVVGIVQL